MKKFGKILLILLAAVLVLGALAAGGAFWYDQNVDRSGWVLSGGVYSYKDFHGDYVSGWQEIEGNTYYFFPETNAMATYWQEIEGKRYYFSGDGTRDTGFWEIDGKRYYFDSSGVMATSWQDLEKGRYYFGTDGVMVSSWQEIDGNRYHFRPSGIMDTGIVRVEGETYHFLDSGEMYTGWDALEEDIYYYLPDGRRALEWQQIEDSLYYFGFDGVMQTGWMSLGEDLYYLGETGAAAVGPTQIDGQLRYFSPQGIHVVLVNSDHKVPDWYTVDLKTIENWHKVSAVCYDNLVKMLTACNNAGFRYEFNSSYRSISQQQSILKQRTKEYEEKGYDSGAAYAIARQSVALPGTSEHHLGLAVDLLGSGAISWLTEHCWEYGFIVRYQGDKAHITGIIDEPRHFRYVGIKVAMDMKDSGLCLEEYLGAVEIQPPAPELPAPEDQTPDPADAAGPADPTDATDPTDAGQP